MILKTKQLNLNKKNQEFDIYPFSSNITKNSVQALYNGEVYYEMESFNPDEELLFNQQTRIMAYHPLRDVNKKCVYYIYIENGNYSIISCQREEDVPSGCHMSYNWCLNIHVKEDIERNIKPLIRQ